MLAPPLVAWSVYKGDRRLAFLVSGALGLVWLIPFFMLLGVVDLLGALVLWTLIRKPS